MTVWAVYGEGSFASGLKIVAANSARTAKNLANRDRVMPGAIGYDKAERLIGVISSATKPTILAEQEWIE